MQYVFVKYAMMGPKEFLAEHFGTVLCLLFIMDWSGCLSAVLEIDKKKKMRSL